MANKKAEYILEQEQKEKEKMQQQEKTNTRLQNNRKSSFLFKKGEYF